jgi:hypothetical protein
MALRALHIGSSLHYFRAWFCTTGMPFARRLGHLPSAAAFPFQLGFARARTPSEAVLPVHVSPFDQRRCLLLNRTSDKRLSGP